MPSEAVSRIALVSQRYAFPLKVADNLGSDFVNNNPKAFENAYFEFGSLNIYS